MARFSLVQTVQAELVIIQAVVAPIVPSHTLDSCVGQCGREERGSHPASRNGRSRHLGHRGRHERLEPRRVGAHVTGVGTFLECLEALAFQIGVEGGVAGDVQCDAPEDKEEGVRHEGGGRLGEAKRPAKVPPDGGLRQVIGDRQARRDTHDVLRPGAPERAVHRAAQELVQVPVVHLQ